MWRLDTAFDTSASFASTASATSTTWHDYWHNSELLGNQLGDDDDCDSTTKKPMEIGNDGEEGKGTSDLRSPSRRAVNGGNTINSGIINKKENKRKNRNKKLPVNKGRKTNLHRNYAKTWKISNVGWFIF